MHPDLMRPASPRGRADDAEAITRGPVRKSLLDLEIGASWSARRMNGLLEPDHGRLVSALPGERRFHRLGIPFRPSPNNCEIFLCDPLRLHHQTKTAGRAGALRHEHQPARFPVEPIDDRNLSTIRDLEGEQMSQFAPECARSSRFARMNEQERRLLHHDEILALRHDREVVRVVCATRVRGG